MKPTKTVLLFVAAVILVTVFLPDNARAAVELIVDHNHPADNVTYFQSIQGAINYADLLVNIPTPTTTQFSVLVEPGTYPETITLKPKIPLRGRETAKTILTGSGSGAIMTASGITGKMSINNFTFTSASIGISSSSSALSIANNVFNLGDSGTAIQVRSAPSTEIANNVFYVNDVGVNTDTDIVITNNIFMNNTTPYSTSLTTLSNLTFNDFFGDTNEPQLTTGSTNTALNPLFVNVSQGDFHLLAGSPVIGIGNDGSTEYDNPSYYPNTQSDLGAYGGSATDKIPFQVSGVTADAVSTTSIDIAWDANLSYLVRGYKVYYGSISGQYNGTDAAEGPSPVNVPSGTALTLNVAASSITPTAPVLAPLGPSNQTLSVSWSSVPDATSYRIYYSDTSFDLSTLPSTSVLVNAPTTEHDLGGLTNGTTYYVAVVAVHQPTYYVAVTAYDLDSAGSTTPGILYESTYSPAAAPVILGTPMPSDLSNMQSDFPEALVAYPNLPNTRQGCFIATAAYGFYSDPQVMALRRFRDRFLMTNAPGRAFVRWYYTYGPAAADWLNAHAEFKPFVRAALLPLVGLALFTTRTAIPVQIGVVLLMAGFLSFLYHRRRLSAGGGHR